MKTKVLLTQATYLCYTKIVETTLKRKSPDGGLFVRDRGGFLFGSYFLSILSLPPISLTKPWASAY